MGWILIAFVVGTFSVLGIEKCEDAKTKRMEIQWKMDSLKHERN